MDLKVRGYVENARNNILGKELSLGAISLEDNLSEYLEKKRGEKNEK